MGHIGKQLCGERGQATLEYLLIGVVLIFAIVALGALWNLVSDGTLSQIVGESASHVLGKPGGVADVLVF